MVETFRLHNLIAVTVLAAVGFLLLKAGLKAVGASDIASMF